MATPQGQSSANTLTQLNALRHETLKDAHHYKSVVPAILSVIAPGNPLDVRRFGADFLAETFASPQLAVEEKQNIAIRAVDLLRQYLDMPGEDAAVVKSVVQASTSIYPLIFKHIIYNPSDSTTWMHMAAIKSNILRRMDTAPSGVKVCCVKFIQRVVQVQTPGLIADPRRPEQNEVSLALVPSTHPLIAPPTLEPEASGLLDRLLSVFQDQQSDALLVTATLNCIGVLLRTRQTISNRILNAVLNFNPFKLADSPPTPRNRVMMKSIERTVRAFLTNLAKRSPTHPMQPRIQGYLDHMQQRRAEMFDENRKRAAPSEPTDGLDTAKRQRLDAPINTLTPPTQFGAPSGPPPGPISLSQLFTLAEDRNQIIDISQFNMAPQLTHQIVAGLLRSIDRGRLDAAVNTIRARWLSIAQAAQPTAPAPPGPPAHPIAPTDNTLNQMQNLPAPELPAPLPADELNLGPLEIPQPPPLNPTQVATYAKTTLDRHLSTLLTLSSSSAKKPQGFTRLAANTADVTATVTLLVRLATRLTAGLTDPNVKSEHRTDEDPSNFSIAETIRSGLLTYILTDFRKRIDVAITWLNEEWYAELINLSPSNPSTSIPTPHTERLTLTLLTTLLPYLSPRDNKLLIRLLSEIPLLTPPIIERVRKMASDPERVGMSMMCLQYLILLRKPVREACLDAVEVLYREEESARGKAGDLLAKWRPAAVQEPEDEKGGGGGGASGGQGGGGDGAADAGQGGGGGGDGGTGGNGTTGVEPQIEAATAGTQQSHDRAEDSSGGSAVQDMAEGVKSEGVPTAVGVA
ncbi:MAG: hypothetical protein Q9159_004032 [Coniocarpon cinnabarinum]